MQWRSKSYTVRLSRKWRLSLTLRRFRTAKHRRSKRYKQLVIHTPLRSIREIAIRAQKKSGRRNARHVFLLWQPQQVASTVLISGGLVGVGIFGIGLMSAQAPASPPVKAFSSIVADATVNAPASLPYSEPTHIFVPDVGIDADIMPVGLASDGSMETPPLFEWLAGWYRLGPSPGQIGPAIIVGHLDTYKGASVFWPLREVQPGSLIHIARADGKVATFKVTGLDQYDQHNFPSDKVYGNLPYAGLRLITCGGTFDTQTLHYSDNTVVSAVFVPDEPVQPNVAANISETLLPKPKTFASYVTTNQ